MIRVYGHHVVVDVRSTSVRKVSKKEFEKSIDAVCAALKRNADDIKYILDNFPEAYMNGGHQLTIRK